MLKSVVEPQPKQAPDMPPEELGRESVVVTLAVELALPTAPGEITSSCSGTAPALELMG